MLRGIRRRGAAGGWLVLAWLAGALARADQAATPVNLRDTLVYKDGDRVQGKILEQAAGVIVFKSERFGELRVPAADAVVIRGEKSSATAAASPGPAPGAAARSVPVVAQGIQPPAAAGKVAAAQTPAEQADEEKLRLWEWFSPAVLTARVRNLFGPWHGRLAFSTEIVSDVADRASSSGEAHLKRKWTRDELTLNSRYDYAETNDVPTTDIAKAWGQWRHEFNKTLFAQYRPTVEWNRASRRQNRPNDYVLMQQEIGLGYHVFTRPTRKVRVGVSENRFDTWNLVAPETHTSREVRSLFEEVELSLPWRMSLTQRGVWYPVPNHIDGWENRIELNKKLTETLSTAVRHEIRRDNPDGSAQDYTRLKLLFGLDF